MKINRDRATVGITKISNIRCRSLRTSQKLMMTSSNIFRVTDPLRGEFPAQRPVTRSFDELFDLRLNKRAHYDVIVMKWRALPRPFHA